MQDRYLCLVQQHMDAATALAAGLHGLPQVGTAFAAAQGAWRFFANPRTTLPTLVEPLREAGRQAAARSASPYALLVHDWSKLDYDGHANKRDLVRLSNSRDVGYEQATAPLVDAASGVPLAPMEIAVLSAAGCHSTAHAAVRPRAAHLEQILPVMQASRRWGVARHLVHVIDREADSLFHLRQWQGDGHRFLIRADDRRVRWRGSSPLLTAVAGRLSEEGGFRFVREVEIRGRRGPLFVAEAAVVLDGPAWQRDEHGQTCRVPGPPLAVRFVAAQVRDAAGAVLAQWLLLTNAPADVGAELVATWYYWRWKIESFHKLIKSAGLQVEEWQQESAAAIAKRLVVACMACVVVWQLEGRHTAAAEACKKFLVDLSGRQTKRRRPVTSAALLAGLHTLLTMLGVLEQYTPEELRAFAATAFSFCPTG